MCVLGVGVAWKRFFVCGCECVWGGVGVVGEG